MSVKATTWAWEQETESSGQRLVLLALADATGGDEDDERKCWPSNRRVAAMTRLAARTVREHIDRLEELGLIAKHERLRRDDGTLGAWVYLVHYTSGGTPPQAADRLRRHTRAQDPSVPIENLAAEQPLLEQPLLVTQERTQAKKRTAFPQDWTPGEAERAAADRAGMNESARRQEWEQFRNHHIAKGSLMLDWAAAWRTWCGNYRSGRFQPNGHRPPVRGQSDADRLAAASRLRMTEAT